MSEILTYSDVIIEIVKCDMDPDYVISLACAITQKQELSNILEHTEELKIKKLITYLFSANHTSVFEHVNATFLIKNVSRSFLAQITRHRMGSFTAASQHYQKYDGYPDIVSEVIKGDLTALLSVEEYFERCNNEYNYLIFIGIPKEEARQVLPNSKAVNILWTVNARSLINFFNQRLCRRNVKEMYDFADVLLGVCIKWWPNLFKLVGPDCETIGGCRQGKMKAKVCIDNGIPDF